MKHIIENNELYVAMPGSYRLQRASLEEGEVAIALTMPREDIETVLDELDARAVDLAQIAHTEGEMGNSCTKKLLDDTADTLRAACKQIENQLKGGELDG